MAKILVEKSNSVLEYSDVPKNPKSLGHLAGAGGDLKNPTRNGRLYESQLWRNVMNSEDYKEGMSTLTLFGENDHPTERVDTSLKEVSVVLTNMEIREDEGILWTEFDILDTPQGQILKSLSDYGCKIGVSSRGLGDEIEKNGVTVIDPETYSFYGFDMVVQPAVKAARPERVENVARAKVTSVFQKAIEDATSKQELNNLKRLAESVNVPNLDSIKESIENKLSNSSNDGNNISEQLENDLGKLASENEDLKTQVENLKKANNISAKRSKHLTETFESEVKEARRTLRRMEVKNERLERVNQELTEDLNQKDSQLAKYEQLMRIEERKAERFSDDLQRQLEEANEEIRNLRKQLREQSRELDAKNNQVERLTESLRDSKGRISELESEISDKTEEIDSLYEENNALNSDLKSISSKTMVTENKVHEVSSRLTEQESHLTETINKYLDAKCMSERVSKKLVLNNLPENYTISDIDMVVEKISDEQRRLNMMPMTLEPISVKLENISGDVDPEYQQTMKLLEGVYNHNIKST